MADKKYKFSPIFYSGKHANKGAKKEWSADDVKRIVDATKARSVANPEEKIPYTVLHPQNDLPVFGFTNAANVRLVTKGDFGLIAARPIEVAEEFMSSAIEGGFDRVSIKLREDWSIRHIGLVDKPAVTDIPPFEFSTDDTPTDAETEFEVAMPAKISPFEFADWRMSTVGRTLRNIKDYFIESLGKEKADTIISNWDLDTLSDSLPEIPQWFMDAVSQLQEKVFPEAKDNSVPFFSTEEENEVTPQEIEALKADKAELERKLALEQRAKEEAQRTANEAQFSAFVETSLQNKIPASDRPALVRALTTLAEKQSYEFSAADGTKTTISEVDVVKKYLAMLPEQVAFGAVVNNPSSIDQSVSAEHTSQIDRLAAMTSTARRV